MKQDTNWKKEVDQAKRHEIWTLQGPGRIVKVRCPGPSVADAGGYITLGKYLVGMTPTQIEVSLGLPQDYLKKGADIYKFRRLPLLDEYEYELTADYPNGLFYNPPMSGDEKYKPGSRTIHQWKVREGKAIPVETDYLHLELGQMFSYDWL